MPLLARALFGEGGGGTMAYRWVTMIEVKEVLRQWLAGQSRKAMAKWVGLDRNTIRRYILVAQQCGLHAAAGVDALTDEKMSYVLAVFVPGPRSRSPTAGPVRSFSSTPAGWDCWSPVKTGSVAASKRSSSPPSSLATASYTRSSRSKPSTPLRRARSPGNILVEYSASSSRTTPKRS